MKIATEKAMRGICEKVTAKRRIDFLYQVQVNDCVLCEDRKSEQLQPRFINHYFILGAYLTFVKTDRALLTL